MARGLDYSSVHPDAQCAANNGYTFMARYVGLSGSGAKYLSQAELDRIRAAGLSVVAVRETTAGFMLTGDGAAHARSSRAHCINLGLFNIPIYYALDVDPRGLSFAEINAVSKFLQDAANADGGRDNVGLYGAYTAIERWVGTTFCRWGWQTYAWSAGLISSKAHFRQYKNGQSVCGGTVDLNETYVADFGQWPRLVPTPPPPPSTSAKDNHMWLVNFSDSDKWFALVGGKRIWLTEGFPAIWVQAHLMGGGEAHFNGPVDNPQPLLWHSSIKLAYPPMRTDGTDD